jgi:hypothetical protein
MKQKIETENTSVEMLKRYRLFGEPLILTCETIKIDKTKEKKEAHADSHTPKSS